jgi:thymidylate synthase
MYRSWDLFSGYLTNNGGFQLLKELMCGEISDRIKIKINPGPTITTCVDLHLYEDDLAAAAAWANVDVSDLVAKLREQRDAKLHSLDGVKI